MARVIRRADDTALSGRSRREANAPDGLRRAAAGSRLRLQVEVSESASSRPTNSEPAVHSFVEVVPDWRGQLRRNEMRRVARWCVNHRLAVIAAGSSYSSERCSSVRAPAVTMRTDPAVSGPRARSPRICSRRRRPARPGIPSRSCSPLMEGRSRATAVRAQIQPMLAKVAHLPNVASVTSPYSSSGAKQLSRTWNGCVRDR